MSTLKKQGIVAFIWDFAGKIANQGSGLIVTIFLARLLEPSEFGLVAMVMVFVGLAMVFTDVGLGSALIQKRHLTPVHYSSVFFFNLTLGSFLTFLMFISAPLISRFYDNPALEPLIHVMAFSFIINAFSAVQSTKLRKELNYAILTKVRFVSSLAAGIIGVTMAYIGYGVWSLIVQILSSQIIYVLLVWKVSGWIPAFSFSLKALKSLWAFGLRMFVSGLLEALFSRLDYMFIGKLFPAATLGFFQRAKSLNMLVISYSSGSLMSVLFPLLSKVQHDLPRFQNIIIKGMGLITFVVFFLLGGLYTTAHEIVLLLFGGKWEPSVEFFKILALSSFAYPVSALLVNVLSSRGNSKAFLELEIYKKLLGITNIIVLYFFGIKAFLYYAVFTSTLAIILNAVYVKKEIGLSVFQLLKPVLVQYALALIAVISVYYSIGWISFHLISGLAVKGTAFLVAYWLLNKFFNTFSYNIFMQEITPLIGKIKRKIRR